MIRELGVPLLALLFSPAVLVAARGWGGGAAPPGRAGGFGVRYSNCW